MVNEAVGEELFAVAVPDLRMTVHPPPRVVISQYTLLLMVNGVMKDDLSQGSPISNTPLLAMGRRWVR